MCILSVLNDLKVTKDQMSICYIFVTFITLNLAFLIFNFFSLINIFDLSISLKHYELQFSC